MPDQDDGYFVRLEDHPRPRRPVLDVPEEPARHRRRRTRIRPLWVIAAVIGGLFLWASTTEGGASARVNDGIDKVREVLGDATSDPDLKRATDFYNEQFKEHGAYPTLNDDEEATSAGVGVDVIYCSSDALVLQGLTASGTVSRLLISGEKIGDVHGKTECPASLTEPAPWTLDKD